MKSPTKLIASCFSFFLLCSVAMAQNNYKPTNTGYVNFNLGGTTLHHAKTQDLELFGCNTSITLGSKFWNGPNGFEWNKANQVLSGIPYGLQTEDSTKEEFYVSKYYIASPPVFKPNGQKDPNTLYDIGIVTPDEFVLDGVKPVQMVYMDYNILKSMYIEYIDITFDSSFDELGVDFIPFRVECNDFPWQDANGIKGGKGASGIGATHKDSTNVSKLFLPYYYSNGSEGKGTTPILKQYLNCEVTLLNDILFHYEVFFVVNGQKYTSLNLKDHKNEQISFHAEYREELPSGCVKAKE
jgi:hypothetical protein